MSDFTLSADAVNYQTGKLAIITGRYNEDIVALQLDGVLSRLDAMGVADTEREIFPVAGAYEMPLAAQWLAQSGRFDAVIALGAVIRGGTPHFEFVAGEASKGLAEVALKTGVPVIFGVLTVDNREQALERADKTRGDKGGEAAITAVEMINLGKQLGVQAPHPNG